MSKCGDCKCYADCQRYVTPYETFPEIGGCKMFTPREMTTLERIKQMTAEEFTEWCYKRFSEYFNKRSAWCGDPWASTCSKDCVECFTNMLNTVVKEK